MIYTFAFYQTDFVESVSADNFDEAVSEMKRMWDESVFDRHGSFQLLVSGKIKNKYNS